MMSSNSVIPEGWTVVSLREILHGIEAGKSFECEQRRAAPDEWGVIKVSAMTWGRFDEDENKAVPTRKDIARRYEIRSGDLLLSRSNTVELVGASVLVNACRPKLLLSDKSMRLLVCDEINRAWLQRVLSSPHVRSQLSSVATGSSNSMRNISQDKVLAVRFGLPPKNEQQRIVEKVDELFSDLDAGVAALKRAKANLKRYRAAVLKAAVEGKLTEEWRATHPTNEPASALLARILKERRQKWEAEQLARFTAAGKEPPKNWREKYVEPTHETGLFELPKSWTWASTLEICERVENGNTPPSHQMFEHVGDIPFIKVYNLTKNGSLDFSINPTFVSREIHDTLLGRSRILPNDVLMNIVGPPLGKVSVVPDDFPEWNTNQAVVLFRTSSGVLPRYLAACLMCDDVLLWITRTARATAGQSNISVGNSRLLPLPLPPVEEQAAIMEILDESLSQIAVAETTIEHGLLRATRLRQSILKQAFEGKLVPQDPKDEPASVLLDRLRANRAVHEGNDKAATQSRPCGRRGKSQQLEGRADE